MASSTASGSMVAEPDGDVGDQPLEAEMRVRRRRQAGLEVDFLRDVENQGDGIACRAVLEAG